MSIDPLPIDAALVDTEGRPTQLFVQHWNRLRAALEALEARSGVSGAYDTETHYLRLTLEGGRVTAVTTEEIPP